MRNYVSRRRFKEINKLIDPLLEEDRVLSQEEVEALLEKHRIRNMWLWGYAMQKALYLI